MAHRSVTNPRLLFLLPSLGYGGMQTRFLTLAEALQRRGGAATFLAGPGQLEERAAAAGSLQLVDWGRQDRASGYDLAARAARGHTAAFVPCDPTLAHTVPALAASLPVSLCLHNLPGTFPGWFGETPWSRTRALIAAMHASRRAILTAASEVQAREHAADLGLPAGAVLASPNGVAIPSEEGSVSSGAIRSVALVARLSPEKRVHAAAAAALVAAGRARGRDVVLDVYGDGPDEDGFKSVLAENLPDGAWHIHGPAARPVDAMCRADVCVGTGRANVEALVSGRRVVAVKSRPDPVGQLGSAVTPASFDTVASDNFTWRTRVPLRAEDVWEQLESLSAEDVAAVRDRVRREYSADAMLERHLAWLDDIDPAREAPDALVIALGRQSASLEDELAQERIHGEAAARHREAAECERAAEAARRESAEHERAAETARREAAEREHSEADRARAEAEHFRQAAEENWLSLKRTRRYRFGAALARPLDAARKLVRRR